MRIVGYIAAMLLATTSVAQKGEGTHAVKDSIVKDDPIVAMLDSLANSHYFHYYDSVSALAGQNPYNYPKDSVPQYPDSVYAKRLEEMARTSPFRFHYNDDVASYIRLYTKRIRRHTSKAYGMSQMYFPMFEEMLDKYNIPLELKHLSIVESAINPRAKSRAGAVGIWQFMYRTGKLYDLDVNSYVDERRDPYKATEAACIYLKYLHSLYDDWDIALAAYNAGPGNVNKAIRRAGGGKMTYWQLRSYLPKETQGYVPAFYAVNYALTYAKEHNIRPIKPAMKYFDYDTVHVSQKVTFDQIAAILCIPAKEVEFLNPVYTKKVIPAPAEGEKNILYLPRKLTGLFVMNEQVIYNYNKEETPQLAEGKTEKVQRTHIVRSGEYLGSIANKYRCSVADLKAWNNLRGTRINSGQRLIVYAKEKAPAAKAASNNNKKTLTRNTDKPGKYTYYTIRKGDTLWDIAKKEGVSVSEIKRLNQDLNDKRLKTGQKIRIKAAG